MNSTRARGLNISALRPRRQQELSPVDRAIVEIRAVDFIQRLLDEANRDVFKNFRLRLELEDVDLTGECCA